MSLLVRAIVHIVQFVNLHGTILNTINYILLFASILDLTEVRQTYLSSEKGEENSKQVSVMFTDIGGIVATKDVECQFNYLVPCIGMLVILPFLSY